LTVREGSDHITLVTEDLFLYGAKDKNFIPNKDAVVKICSSVASYPGVNESKLTYVFGPSCSEPSNDQGTC